MMKSVWLAGAATAALAATIALADPPAGTVHRHGGNTAQSDTCQHGANHTRGMHPHGGAGHQAMMARHNAGTAATGEHANPGQHGMAHRMQHGKTGESCPMHQTRKTS